MQFLESTIKQTIDEFKTVYQNAFQRKNLENAAIASSLKAFEKKLNVLEDGKETIYLTSFTQIAK